MNLPATPVPPAPSPGTPLSEALTAHRAHLCQATALDHRAALRGLPNPHRVANGGDCDGAADAIVPATWAADVDVDAPADIHDVDARGMTGWHLDTDETAALLRCRVTPAMVVRLPQLRQAFARLAIDADCFDAPRACGCHGADRCEGCADELGEDVPVNFAAYYGVSA